MDNLDAYLKEWIQYPGLRALEIKLTSEKLQKCAKCGCLYPETQYDCPNCHYSSGGD